MLAVIVFLVGLVSEQIAALTVRRPGVVLVSTHMPRAVWVAVAVGIAARLAFSLGYWVDKPLTHDEHEYLLLARNVADGRGFVYPAA